MAESATATALRTKRDELERIIGSYEKSISAARRDLAHINATLELFEREGVECAYPSRLSIARMFKRGEIFGLCKAALAAASDGLDTRELALAVIRAKRMDEIDAILRKAICFRIVQAMLRQEIRGHVASNLKRKGVRVWQLNRNGTLFA
ncbi:MAG: hypothetical protein ACRED2_09010 [Methylocella sp.]